MKYVDQVNDDNDHEGKGGTVSEKGGEDDDKFKGREKRRYKFEGNDRWGKKRGKKIGDESDSDNDESKGKGEKGKGWHSCQLQ